MRMTSGKINWTVVNRQIAERQAALESGLDAPDAARLEECYRQRARQLATRSTEAAASVEAMPVLIFSVSGERLSIDLSAVVEILPYAKCSALPGAWPELLGVINNRGRIWSVLELAALLGIPRGTSGQDGYIVIARRNAAVVGLRVDELHQIESATLQSAQKAAKDLAPLNPRFIRNWTSSGVGILEIDAIFDHPIFQSTAPSPAARREPSTTWTRSDHSAETCCTKSEAPPLAPVSSLSGE